MDKVSCSMTQHSDSSESRTSNASIHSVMLYQLSHSPWHLSMTLYTYAISTKISAGPYINSNYRLHHHNLSIKSESKYNTTRKAISIINQLPLLRIFFTHHKIITKITFTITLILQFMTIVICSHFCLCALVQTIWTQIRLLP